MSKEDREYWAKVRKEMEEKRKKQGLDRTEEALWKSAGQEIERRGGGDQAWEEVAKEMFGENIADIEADLHAADNPSDADIREAMAAFDTARKQAKDGIFRQGDVEKAMNTLKKNERVIKRARKKTKRGCMASLIVLTLIGGSAAAGSVWGAVEVISALM